MNTRDTHFLEIMRHSFAHVLAQAVLRIFPGTKLGVGPAIEDGFYHDFLFNEPIKLDSLKKIEAEIRKIIGEELPFQQVIVSKEQAFDILHLQGQILKTEILQNIPDSEVSFYKTGGDYIDLCRGPHVENTGKLGAFKLTGISGSHWNNDESRPLMQRIHGIAFENETELQNFLNQMEVKKQYDHRKIAQKLRLYIIDDETGAGLPLWLPKGYAIQKSICNYIYKQNLKNQYKYISTPSIARSEFYEISGDTAQSKNYIFPEVKVDEDGFSLKPRSLPHHLVVYNSAKRSYRELPYKISEFATLYRNEQSGELNGLTRVRSFLNDSNTIICTKEQIKEELIKSIETTKQLYKDFGIENYRIELALKGANESIYHGQPKDWLTLQNIIVDALKVTNSNVYEAPNTAERSGPGINFKFYDVYNTPWQLGSIFFDMNLPEVFKLRYTDSKNVSQIPYVINRTSIGSIERFFALIIEQYGGSFPLWLSPTQVTIIPISEKFNAYAQAIHNELIDKDIYAYLDTAPETMQNKIRQSQSQLVPYMLIVGAKEEENATVSVRPRSGQDLGMMKIGEFIAKIHHEIENKVIF